MKTIISALRWGFFLLFISTGSLVAQVSSADLRNLDTTDLVKVHLSDGSVYEGYFVRQTSKRIVIKVAGTGEKEFLLDDIRSMDYESRRRESPVSDTARLVQVALTDGSVLVGSIISRTEKEMVLLSATAGTVTIPADKIKSISGRSPEVSADRKTWLPNPNPTRYFFAPSAFNLKKGEGYYQNVWVDLNLFGYGITDWFSMGAGIEVLGTLAMLSQGIFNPLYVLTPKLGFPISKKWHAGGGLIGGIYRSDLFGTSDADLLGLGIAYGVVTYGNVDNNLTLGIGLPLVTEKNYSPTPIIVLNGMYRISQKISLISENWIFTGSNSLTQGAYAVLGYGIRLSGPTTSFDIGFINNKDLARFLIVGIPYVDFVYKFGKPKK